MSCSLPPSSARQAGKGCWSRRKDGVAFKLPLSSKDQHLGPETPLSSMNLINKETKRDGVTASRHPC